MVVDPTCFTKGAWPSLNDVILTNKPNYCMKEIFIFSGCFVKRFGIVFVNSESYKEGGLYKADINHFLLFIS
jgi:hypothetical protein